MIKAIIFIAILLRFSTAWAQSENASNPQRSKDSVTWISVSTDSGIVHAAVAVPNGNGPFPAIIILHGTHGFGQEYVKLARGFAANGFIGIAACWFAGGKGAGQRFITPIEFKDAPPFIDVAGSERFRIARTVIDSLIGKIITLPYVQKNNLALMGHSRGAGASLDYVLTHPGKAQALVLNSCGYPPAVTKRAAEVSAPLFILHGITDNATDGGSDFTKITMAHTFEAALRAANKDVEVKYFESGGHNSLFTNPSQFDNTIRLVVAFLKRKMFL